MNTDVHATRRTLNQLEHIIREANREVLNGMIPTLNHEQMLPVLAVVAKARGTYLQELFRTVGSSAGAVPTDEQLQRLKQAREIYEELMAGAQALETAIGRGYLDIEF